MTRKHFAFCAKSYTGAGVGGWRQENEKWKYYDASGILLTGWVKNGNDWYYIDPSTGEMVTGWLHTADGHSCFCK